MLPIIIIPFRHQDETPREEQLKILLLRFDEMFCGDHRLIVVEQDTRHYRKFNRGKLLNIGFDIACRVFKDVVDTASIIFHDVDLLPTHDLSGEYVRVRRGECNHLAKVWKGRYCNDRNYFGGVLATTKYDFRLMNGFPNNYWGWGGEDEELLKRARWTKLRIISPQNGEYEDLEQLNLEQKLRKLREHKRKCMNKWELLKESEHTWSFNGLNNLYYTIKKQKTLKKGHFWYTVRFFGDAKRYK